MPTQTKTDAPTRVASGHVRQLEEELAKAAGLTHDEAERVLSVLHVKQLVENTNTLNQLLADDGNLAALGISRAHADERRAVASAESLTLANLRVGLKPKSLSSIIV